MADKVRMTLTIEVDPEKWANEYGLANLPDAVASDLHSYFKGQPVHALVEVQDVRREGELTDEQAGAIRRALSSLRYSGMMMRSDGVGTIDDLVRYLTTFSEVLAFALDQQEEEVSRLKLLERDVAAMRRLLGTDPEGGR